VIEILKDCGMDPIVPDGSYFIFASISNIPEEKYFKHKKTSKDHQFCRWLTEEIGVTAIPPTSFYSPQNKHIAENYARFAFCKRDDVIEQAHQRLSKLKLLH